MNKNQRSSGILLHPTCLPSPYGIGDLGQEAHRFVNYLSDLGQTHWQILPLGPTGYGNSPYQTLSAFAGNENLISLEKLLERGWLHASDLQNTPNFPSGHVDFAAISPWRQARLEQAFRRFQSQATAGDHAELELWRSEQQTWLEDYALFRALKVKFHGASWVDWPGNLAMRETPALTLARQELAPEISRICFQQWLFHQQWRELKAACHAKKIQVIGDIPIFVAHDSHDVWAQQELFDLEESGHPRVVAGVPPDYFSASGQRWGNPLYRWERMRADDFSWWLARMRATLALVDEVRIDHFRGFEAYWEIPASEPTAIIGSWQPGPGADLFHRLQDVLGNLPIIAEDLGVVTAKVEALRDAFCLPGMKVLQFAWSDPKNPFLPHNYPRNCIAYVGTHDNNTTLGWWQEETDEGARHFAAEYLATDLSEPNWALMRCGMRSVARTFIATMPDLLGLGSCARMNTPGVEQGNWTWRLPISYTDHPGGAQFAHLTSLTCRHPNQQEAINDNST